MSSSEIKKDDADAENLRHRPFYEVLLDSLEVYDYPKESKFMRRYNGLLGRPDMFNNTAQYVCWDKKIFSRKLLHWDLKPGIETDPDKINMEEWGELNDDIRDTLKTGPIDWSKLLYCLTMKLFFFPIPQISYMFWRFFAIFMRVLDKALVIIFASIGNSLNTIGQRLCKTIILLPIGLTILAFNNIIMGIFQIIFYGINTFFSNSSKLIAKSSDEDLIRQEYGFSYIEVIDSNGVKSDKEIEVFPSLQDVVYSYLGLVLPIGEFNSKFGQKYGNGGLGLLILTIMAISAILIFVGGSSITVAFVGFLMYIFKVIKMLGDFKTEDAGKSTSKTAEK